MDILLYILAGAGVGLAVGITGVGGGSLMTPLLLMFGYPTHIAIGTDLLYASITKASGVVAHHRQQTIEWKIVAKLAAGSIPASILTTYLLATFFTDPTDYNHILVSTLGVMLIATSAVLLFKSKIRGFWSSNFVKDQTFIHKHTTTIVISMGALLGFCVTLSSVGAGAFGAAILLILFPALQSVKIIGTDIAHAVPLTLLAGAGHMFLGNVDFLLLGCLLIGSLPAIQLGVKFAKHLPEKVMQPALASVLFVIGLKYAFF